MGRLSAAVPERWLGLRALKSPTYWAIVLQDTGTGQFSLAMRELGDCREPFDLFVVTARPEEAQAACASTAARNVVVLPTLSAGEDWALLGLVNSRLLNPYDVILLRSLDGYASLPVSDADIRLVLRAYKQDPTLGIVTARSQAVMTRRRSARGAARLLRRLELDVPDSDWRSPVGTDYWIRGFLLQGLRALNASEADFTAGRSRRRAIGDRDLAEALGALTREAGCRVVDLEVLRATPRTESEPGPTARVFAFYLPQFHPVAENDEWWGPGFTEWTNVSAARPVYRGHFQPKLPEDLGFYDLRLDETRRHQTQLARAHGIAGFMYYHYWFAGRRILERPLESLLDSNIDFPFCVMWANENWTRTWDGGDHHVLLEQEFETVPTGDFIDHLIPVMKDPRYLRIEGRAVVSIYKPGLIPCLRDAVDEWRRRASAQGVSLLVLGVSGGLEGSPQDQGLDGSMRFPPHTYGFDPAILPRLRRSRRFSGSLWDYGTLVSRDEERLAAGIVPTAFPSVMVNFDNTARRPSDGWVWVGSNPYTFRRWLLAAVRSVADRPYEERVVFVNAWNEWAEGAILEPTSRFGSSFLLAVRDVVRPEPAAY